MNIQPQQKLCARSIREQQGILCIDFVLFGQMLRLYPGKSCSLIPSFNQSYAVVLLKKSERYPTSFSHRGLFVHINDTSMCLIRSLANEHRRKSLDRFISMALCHSLLSSLTLFHVLRERDCVKEKEGT